MQEAPGGPGAEPPEKVFEPWPVFFWQHPSVNAKKVILCSEVRRRNRKFMNRKIDLFQTGLMKLNYDTRIIDQTRRDFS